MPNPGLYNKLTKEEIKQTWQSYTVQGDPVFVYYKISCTRGICP